MTINMKNFRTGEQVAFTVKAIRSPYHSETDEVDAVKLHGTLLPFFVRYKEDEEISDFFPEYTYPNTAADYEFVMYKPIIEIEEEIEDNEMFLFDNIPFSSCNGKLICQTFANFISVFEFFDSDEEYFQALDDLDNDFAELIET